MIDLSHVPDRHAEIDARLREWGSWVRVHPRLCGMQPMFRMYQSKARQWETEPHIHVEINTLAALQIERAVSQLPEKHRAVIRFCYVWPWISAGKVRRELGVAQDTMARLLQDSRDMVRNTIVKTYGKGNI